MKKPSLTQWIFIGMVFGLLLGWLLPDIGIHARPLSQIFLRLIKCIIAPLLFSTLVVGIAAHGNLKEVGRIGIKSLVYFEVVTTLALFIGLAAVNVTQPGVGVKLQAPPGQAKDFNPKTSGPQQLDAKDMIVHVFPESFFDSAARGDVLQVVVFSVLFGAALAGIKRKKPLLDFCESVTDTMFRFTSFIMRFAPVGVGAAICYTVAHSGLGVLMNLGMLVLTLYLALIVFAVVVLGSVVLLFRIPLKRFVRAVWEPAVIAFSTTSSEAALPKAMENMEKMGVPRRIVAFVLPTGYSFNLDGTTLYLSMAAIFLAQAGGVHLGLGQQIMVMLSLMLTSKGVAAIPRASLVILAGTAASFGLPVEGVAVILGVDELMDMARTTVNLVGNCLACAVMARWEGVAEWDRDRDHPAVDGAPLTAAALERDHE